MNPTKTQNQLFDELLELRKLNPEMEIKFLVETQNVYVAYEYAKQQIVSVGIKPWLEVGENILTYEAEIKDHLAFGMYHTELTEEQITQEVDELYAKIPKVICVFLELVP